MTPDFWFGFGCAVVSQVGLCAAAVGVAIYYAEDDPYLSEFEDGDPEFCPYCYHELPAKPCAEDPRNEDGDPEFCPYCYHELPAKPRAQDPLSEDRND